MTKTLIIGLGNPILGDDGVGWHVAEEVKRRVADREWPMANSETAADDGKHPSAISQQPSAIEVDFHAGGGLSLMERLVGYDRAVIVDALWSGRPAGGVSCSRLDDLPDFSSAHTSAAHDTSLQNALRLGRMMGAHLPEGILVVGVEAQSVYDFGEILSPPVAEAVPLAARRVLELLEDKSHGLP